MPRRLHPLVSRAALAPARARERAPPRPSLRPPKRKSGLGRPSVPSAVCLAWSGVSFACVALVRRRPRCCGFGGALRAFLVPGLASVGARVRLCAWPPAFPLLRPPPLFPPSRALVAPAAPLPPLAPACVSCGRALSRADAPVRLIAGLLPGRGVGWRGGGGWGCGGVCACGGGFFSLASRRWPCASPWAVAVLSVTAVGGSTARCRLLPRV